MRYNIRGNKIDVTEAINDYIKSKLSKLEKYLDDNDEVEAKAIVSAKGKDQKVEVTIWSGKYNIRAEVVNPDLYSAIDLVIDKLERQFKKYRGKLTSKRNSSKEPVMPEIEEYFEEEYDDDDDNDDEIDDEKTAEISFIDNTTLDDLTAIADSIIDGHITVVDISETSHEDKVRIFDFISGVVYAVGGEMKKIRDGTCVVVLPEGLDMDDFKAALAALKNN